MTANALIQPTPVSASKIDSWSDFELIHVSSADYREPEMFGPSIFPQAEGPQRMPLVIDIDGVLGDLKR